MLINNNNNNTIAIPIPAVSKNMWNKNMFTVIGIINTAPTAVYRFVSNNTPAISSVIAIKGNMYSEPQMHP